MCFLSVCCRPQGGYRGRSTTTAKERMYPPHIPSIRRGVCSERRHPRQRCSRILPCVRTVSSTFLRIQELDTLLGLSLVEKLRVEPISLIIHLHRDEAWSSGHLWPSLPIKLLMPTKYWRRTVQPLDGIVCHLRRLVSVNYQLATQWSGKLVRAIYECIDFVRTTMMIHSLMCINPSFACWNKLIY